MKPEAPTEFEWRVSDFEQLSLIELFEIMKLRQAIFIIEQNCPYPDIDDVDKHCLHLCAWDQNQLAAYTRVIKPGVSYTQASIGRVATHIDYRGTGLGRQLMLRSIDLAEEKFPNQPIKIGAQQQLEKFYNELGFETISEPYDEDGIMHIHMLKD